MPLIYYPAPLLWAAAPPFLHAGASAPPRPPPNARYAQADKVIDADSPPLHDARLRLDL